VAYVLLHEYGLDLPRGLQIAFSQVIQTVTEDTGTEITSYEIHRRFMSEYVERPGQWVELVGHRATTDTLDETGTVIEARLLVGGEERSLRGEGNGPIDAFVHALQAEGLFPAKIVDYHEHAIGAGSDATAAAYVEVDTGDRDTTWGVGLHESIVSASLRAVIGAVNGLHEAERLRG
jgi:2-isopropylmalate synthase